MSKLKAIVVDIDGTLANIDHRRRDFDKKDWKTFFDRMVFDTVNEWCRQLIITYVEAGYRVLLVTGRPEDYKIHTVSWLAQNKIPYSKLMMRPRKNYEQDALIKKQIFFEEIEPNYDVHFVVDDRQQVVDMWRSIGMVCLQCDKGDY